MRREIHRRIRRQLRGVDLASDVDAAVSINVGGARTPDPEAAAARERGREERRPHDDQEVPR
jgi:hypothetical protein